MIFHILGSFILCPCHPIRFNYNPDSSLPETSAVISSGLEPRSESLTLGLELQSFAYWTVSHYFNT